MSSSSYTLTAEDVEPGYDYNDPPAVRAAGNSNPAVLKAVLQHGWQKSPHYSPNGSETSLANQYGPNAFMGPVPYGGDSPLLRAIDRRLPQNVETLLEAGADPNGLPVWMLRASIEESTASLPYQRPDPVGHIHPFWSSAMSHFQVNKLKTQAVVAVEAAAGHGLDAVIDQLVVHGADLSSWKADIPPTPPSSLSASSPLHAAITGRHTTTLAHLLSPPLSLNLNFIPQGSPVRQLTPAMHALCTTPPNLDALFTLLANPLFDAGICTPTFDVHLAHFAAAHLSASLLRELAEKLPTALHDAGCTARGHTLLHIVCLPRDETHINVFAPRVHRSVRFVSVLDPTWKPTRLYARCPRAAHGVAAAQEEQPPVFGRQDEGFFDAQLEVLDFLRESNGAGGMKNMVSQADEDGNTALHFLAGYRSVNMRAVEMLRALDEGEGVWETARNRWGFTPRELFDDGARASEARHMKFWEEGYESSSDEDPRMPCFGCARAIGGRG
ncbi:hypothetical protein C8R43DRAFT_974157 [Mycena crocata]|nr:hypothetical protein C8R43DRAFT_974157 [Mycena crocata]